MSELILDIRLESYSEPIGELRSTIDGGTTYSYTTNYLERSDKVPLSLALPLQEGQFGDQKTRAFFDNLLPENDQLKQVMEREGLERTDIVGLLFHLGADCPGAISCIPTQQSITKIPGILNTDYDALPEHVLRDIVRRLADREPLPNELKDPSPLAGVQQKIALTLLPSGGFGIPKPGLRVPTTHILKVPRRTKGREALLEAASAQLAQAVNLDVVIPTALNIGGFGALLVPRFDRIITAEGGVRRIHQEDFAQALGLPAGLKYERYGSSSRRFDSKTIAELLDKTAEPAASKRIFLRSTIFNMAVGNTDNHAKNNALLYDRGPTPRLAPLYDILPIRLDGTVTHQLSFDIGNAKYFDNLTQADLQSFFVNFGLSKTASVRFFSEEIAVMLAQLDTASKNLTRQGLKDFDDLIGRESTRLDGVLETKVDLRRRDYFAPKGGGWAINS